jgi:hypothetical protein
MLNKKIFLILSFVSICEGFFSIDISKLINQTTNGLNLTCFYYDFTLINCDYCVYQYYSNGSSSSINFDCIQITNSYKILSKQCEGFSDQRDIGYGICSPLSFDLSDISILCICATNMCNTNFTACQSSVNYQIKTNIVPSVLPSIIPDLSKTISCIDTFYPIGPNSSNISSYCMDYPSPFINFTECNEYVLNNTVLCLYSPFNDNYDTFSLTKDSYLMYLSDTISSMNQFIQDSNDTQYYNETSSYFYVEWDSMNDNRTWGRCFCAQDNCDSSLTNCLNSNRSISIINCATSSFFFKFL